MFLVNGKSHSFSCLPTLINTMQASFNLLPVQRTIGSLFPDGRFILNCVHNFCFITSSLDPVLSWALVGLTLLLSEASTAIL
jgi:hypothetical protein